MLNLGKRVVGELIILLVVMQFSYFLLSALSTVSMNMRIIFVSVILMVVSVLIIRSN
ncbi:MAG: hypothetical protein GOV01_03855 [Candidatus Altiarchaeota archaeon]|nr:hypothetical protein [Candidatus Altiarchaeota archaeon]